MNIDRVDKRIDTFQQGRKGSLKRNIWPFSNQQAKKKFLDGEFLAKLGFYFKPTTKDHVICYFCHLECDWVPDFEHPLAYHLENQPCSLAFAWALACSRNEKMKSIISKAKDKLEGLDYQALLLDTFRDWPHGFDQSAKQGLCAELMAEAGFCFQPMTGSPDHTCCTFCSVTLEGWDPTDDPIAEHRKRSLDCIFFKYYCKKNQEETESAKPTKGKKTTVSNRKNGKAKADAKEDVIEQEDEKEDEAAEAVPPTKTKVSKSKNRARKNIEEKSPEKSVGRTTRQKTAAQKAKQLVAECEKEEVEESEPVIKKKQSRKAKPVLEEKEVAKIEIAVESVKEAKDSEPLVTKKNGRRAKLALEEEVLTEQEVVAEPVKSKIAAKKSKKVAVSANDASKKRKGRMAKGSVALDDEAADDVHDEEKSDETSAQKVEDFPIEVAMMKPKRGKKKKAKEPVSGSEEIPTDLESEIVSAVASNEDIHENPIESNYLKKRSSGVLEELDTENPPIKKMKKSKQKKAKLIKSEEMEKKTRKQKIIVDENKENDLQSFEEEIQSLEENKEPKELERLPLSPVQSFSFPADTTPQLLQMTQELMNKTNLEQYQIEEFLKKNQELPALEFMEKLGTMAREKLDVEWTRKMAELGL